MPASIDQREVAAVFAGGCLGALARAGLAEAFLTHPGRWPWVTFGVNVVGAALLGYFATRVRERPYRRSFLTTGFCGALTTFSTLQVEILGMLDHGHGGLALGYETASVAAGFIAVAAVTRITRRVRVAV